VLLARRDDPVLYFIHVPSAVTRDPPEPGVILEPSGERVCAWFEIETRHPFILAGCARRACGLGNTTKPPKNRYEIDGLRRRYPRCGLAAPTLTDHDILGH
jgi:hypothetical protein